MKMMSRASAIAFTLTTCLAPVAASDLSTEVTLMARIGSSTTATFSPDGKRVAFISNMSGIPQIWTVSSSSGWPTQVTAFDDPVSGVQWSPDGEWLAFSVAPGGGMNTQVYLARPDGSGLKRITAGGKENNNLGLWDHDGRRLMLGSNVEDPASIDAYLYEVASGTTRLAARARGVGGLTDLSRDGRLAVLGRTKSRGDSDLFLVELATGRETLLTQHEGPGSFGDGTFSPDGRTIYLGSNKDRDLVALGRIRLSANGAPGPIEVIASRDDAELGEFTISDDGSLAVLVWNVAGRSQVDILELATGRTTPIAPLPAEIVFGVTLSKDGRLAAMTSAGAASPADIFIYDRSVGRFTRLTESPHAGVDLASMVRPELVRFPAHDGIELTGWLYRPRGAAAPGPIVLSFHGGPEGQERPGFNSTYQALLSRGIAVLAPNVRGSSGFGKRFVNLDNGALRVDGVRDLKSCAEYVVKTGVADPRRIGIMGGSYGGYMVMAGLTRYPDTFAAGANLFGVVNFETFFAHTEPWMAAISTIEYGDPATQKEMLRELSPIHAIDKVVAPTIVLHGANDTNVPVVEAEQVVDNLKKRGIPVEYVLFPDEGHGFRKTPNRIRSTVSIVQWFEKYLKG